MLKRFEPAFALLVAACLCSCANHSPKQLVLEAVGPDGPQVQTTGSSSTNGTLLVYSAYRRNADFNSRDPNRPEYSDYEIFSDTGVFLRRIHNNSGTILQEAVPAMLPAGKYKVKARANGYGFVIVPVIIVPGQTTTLHLEGDSN